MLRIYREDELDVLAFLLPHLPLAHSLDLSHILYRAYFPLAFPSSEQIQCKISYTITALNLLNCRRTTKNTLHTSLLACTRFPSDPLDLHPPPFNVTVLTSILVLLIQRMDNFDASTLHVLLPLHPHAFRTPSIDTLSILCIATCEGLVLHATIPQTRLACSLSLRVLFIVSLTGMTCTTLIYIPHCCLVFAKNYIFILTMAFPR